MKSKTIFTLKAIAVVAVAAGIVTSGFEIKETKATLAAPSGKCGALMTANNAGLSARLSSWNSATSSTLVVFDFDNGTATYDGVDVNNYGSNSTVSSADSGSASFTMTAGAFAGSYVLSFSGDYQMNIVSTNGGNTILMSDVATSSTSNANLSTGICQAL